MEPKHLGALALILFGGYFLFGNLGILRSSHIFWPSSDCPGTSRSLPSELETKTHSQ